ncbi:MAG: C39 family peptidase [Elusimicrobia bacterium]|nr:C39 family peptidase [Elusimicrobiota bacterium]
MAKLDGALPLDLMLAAQERGLMTKAYSGSLENLKAGHPLLVLLNLDFRRAPKGHYVVITGFDERRRGVYVHYSSRKDHFMDCRRFLSGWEKTDRWTLLALPQEEAHRWETMTKAP